MIKSIIIPIFIIIVMEIYLIIQAKLDAKTGYVYSAPNNWILIFGLVIFTIYQLANYQDVVISVIEATFIGIILYFMSADFLKDKKIMQVSDAKAYAGIYLSSYMIVSQAYAFYVFCITIIMANISMVIYYRCIKKCKFDERKPYFPFIFLGYTGSIIINIIMYYFSTLSIAY